MHDCVQTSSRFSLAKYISEIFRVWVCRNMPRWWSLGVQHFFRMCWLPFARHCRAFFLESLTTTHIGFSKIVKYSIPEVALHNVLSAGHGVCHCLFDSRAPGSPGEAISWRQQPPFCWDFFVDLWCTLQVWGQTWEFQIQHSVLWDWKTRPSPWSF